jgi:uncharacterized membrane protein
VSATPGQGRLGYLDWLRGLTVLVMIEAHAFDAWTLPQEKARAAYGWLMVLGGMAAPAFLFMAGIAVALGAAAQVRRGRSPAEAARLVERRGWQIFLYAFLFRFQSYALGGFSNAAGLLKVDILNIMGPGIVAAACVWRLPGTRLRRALVLTAAAALISMSTPAIRSAGWLSAWPDPLEWYIRPDPGKGTFTLFPWAAFVLAGAVLGLALDGGRAWEPWRLQGAIAAAGIALGAASYWASWQPALFPSARFWTTSPSFFGLRVGLLVVMVAAAWLWSVRPWPRLIDSRPLEVLGVGSLFVYWVHVELVYGGATLHLRRQLTLEQAAVAWVLFTGGMYLLLLGWNHLGPARAKFRESFLNPLLSRA